MNLFIKKELRKPTESLSKTFLAILLITEIALPEELQVEEILAAFEMQFFSLVVMDLRALILVSLVSRVLVGKDLSVLKRGIFL